MSIGFTPRLLVHRLALTRGRNLVLAALRCSSKCTAHVTLRQGKRRVTKKVSFTGSHRVGVTTRTFPTRKRRVRITVTWDNSPVRAAANVRLPSR